MERECTFNRTSRLALVLPGDKLCAVSAATPGLHVVDDAICRLHLDAQEQLHDSGLLLHAPNMLAQGQGSEIKPRTLGAIFVATSSCDYLRLQNGLREETQDSSNQRKAKANMVRAGQIIRADQSSAKKPGVAYSITRNTSDQAISNLQHALHRKDVLILSHRKSSEIGL